LIDEIQLTQEQMSERVGKSVLQLRITKTLKLDPLSKQVSVTDSLVWSRTPSLILDQEVQTDIYQKIVSQNLSVRDTRNTSKNYQESLKPKPAGKPASFEMQMHIKYFYKLLWNQSRC
jgi:ParB family chromosome partitioning protein